MLLSGLLIVGSVVAGVTGLKKGVRGAKQIKQANEKTKETKKRHEKNIAHLNKEYTSAATAIDELGKRELTVLSKFKEFSDCIEFVQNRPQFADIKNDYSAGPKVELAELKKVSVGANTLLGGLSGAALGTAGGFAAAGVTTSAVMAFGTASTGTAIAGLSGAAATNATLAAIGGGAVAAGGGGMALGTAILGGATLGVGLLVGGFIFNKTGNRLSEKADEAWKQMIEAEKKMKKSENYLGRLKVTSSRLLTIINKLFSLYEIYLRKLQAIVFLNGKCDYIYFDDNERLITENCVLLVSALFNITKIQIVTKTNEKEGTGEINTSAIESSLNNGNRLVSQLS